MLLSGTILQGRYSIVHKLGEGGMGAVYEAVDGRFGTPIALKEIVFEAVDADQTLFGNR
jgi:serine/threonine protein kinase